MANGYSNFQAAVRASGNLHTRAYQNYMMEKMKGISLQYMGLGTELNSEFVELGCPLAIGAMFMPESFRIRFAGTGGFSVPVFFAKLTTVDGTAQNGRLFNSTWARSTTTVTVTTPSPHGFGMNQQLSITGSSSTAAVPNGGTGIITVLSDTTFSFTCLDAGDSTGTLAVAEVISGQRAATWARTTTTMTVTTQGAHGYVSNQILQISAISDTLPIGLGLTGVITVTGATTFTFAVTSAGATSGTITLGPAAGNYVPLTSSAAFTNANIYTGVGVQTVSNGPIGLGPIPRFRKEDKLIMVWGVITTVPPVGRMFYISGSYHEET